MICHASESDRARLRLRQNQQPPSSVYLRIDMCLDMCMDVCMDTCTDTCADMGTVMGADMP